MNQRPENLILGTIRIARVIACSFKIRPYYFLVVTLLRTAIRLLYFTASILPFKILLIISTEYSIPSFLDPYFSNNVSLAYALCLLIGVAMFMTKVLEMIIEYIARLKTKVMLGDNYSRKPKRRDKLHNFIRKATDSASSCIIIVVSTGLLLAIEYQIAIVVFTLSVLCLVTFLMSWGKLGLYLNSSPEKYMEDCVTGISLIAFFSLVHISLNSAIPPPFLSLLVSLILIRQYTQSLDQVVSVALFFKNKDASIERVFTKL